MSNSTEATAAAYAAESRVDEILLGTIIPSVLAIIFVVGRLYSRAFLTRGLGADDAWISVSAVLGLTLTIINCVFVRYGSGHHQSVQSVQDAWISAKMSYAARTLYQTVLGTTKIGICAFYLRIFQDRRSKILIYSMMGFTCLYFIPLTIYVLAACRPEADPARSSPLVCSNNSPDLYMSAICNIVMDFLLLLFVVPRIIPLKMERKQKVALLGVVCLGVLVIIAAIVRLVQVLQFNNSKDHTWDIASITTWSAVEVDTGLFCASAPAIKPLIRKLTPGFISSSFADSHSDPTKLQGRSNYGVGTQSIHSRPAEAFELNSQTDLHMGRSKTSNKVWRGDEESKGTHWDDSTSEDAVLGVEQSKGAIVKTVSVTVTNSRNHDDGSMERRNSVSRFEMV